MSRQRGVSAVLSVHVCVTLHMELPLYVLPANPKDDLSILPTCAY